MPHLRLRVVDVVDLVGLMPPGAHPATFTVSRFHDLFTDEVDVLLAFHGHPRAIHHMLHGRPESDRFHVRGFTEHGTTTPFDMVVLNRGAATTSRWRTCPRCAAGPGRAERPLCPVGVRTLRTVSVALLAGGALALTGCSHLHDGVTRMDACSNGARCLLLGSRHQRRRRDDRTPAASTPTTVTYPTT